MDSLALLEEWIEKQPSNSFVVPNAGPAANELRFDDASCAFTQDYCSGFSPIIDPALDAGLDDYLPYDPNFDTDWLLGESFHTQPTAADEALGAGLSHHTDVDPHLAQSPPNTVSPSDDRTR